MTFDCADDFQYDAFRHAIAMLNTMYNLRLTRGYEYTYANHSYELRIKDEHAII